MVINVNYQKSLNQSSILFNNAKYITNNKIE